LLKGLFERQGLLRGGCLTGKRALLHGGFIQKEWGMLYTIKDIRQGEYLTPNG